MYGGGPHGPHVGVGAGYLGVFGVFPVIRDPYGATIGLFIGLEFFGNLIKIARLIFDIVGAGGFFSHHILADALGAADYGIAFHFFVEAEFNGLPHDAQSGGIEEGCKKHIDIGIDFLQERAQSPWWSGERGSLGSLPPAALTRFPNSSSSECPQA